jgi:hypothetical protein
METLLEEVRRAEMLGGELGQPLGIAMRPVQITSVPYPGGDECDRLIDPHVDSAAR